MIRKKGHGLSWKKETKLYRQIKYNLQIKKAGFKKPAFFYLSNIDVS